MFGSIGITELIVIFVVALLVIGPKRLPEVAKSLGRALGEFKRATTDFQRSMNLDEDFDVDAPESPPTTKTSEGEEEAKASEDGEEAPKAEGEAAAEGEKAAEDQKALVLPAPENTVAREPQPAAEERERGSQAT